ncbi:AAA family ATPase [Tissierella sp. MSJ-40]|uniref:endopeptidase La n=1 Tax=Tissierella simiarum TaxID=2841534 RepID=A0ABS6E6E6_9FIRM|nr:AAA family ATPase [Tissierella simiarum]
MEKYRIPIEKLNNSCNPNIFPYNTTETIIVYRELIGQERAMEALKHGLSIKRKGYNIFVAGLTGTGRNSYSYLVAKDFADKKNTPRDWCYVYNFKKPNSPKPISLTHGKGKIFKIDVEEAIKTIDSEISKALSSKDYEDKKNKIYNEHQEMAQKIIKELNTLAKDYNFTFKQTERGILSIPLMENRPMTDEEIDNLTDDELEEIKNLSLELSQKAYDYVKRVKEVENNLKEEINELRESNVLDVVKIYLEPLKEKYEDNEDIIKFFSDIQDDIVENYEMFLDKEEESIVENIFFPGNKKEEFLKRYEINLFIDNDGKKGAPVVREMNPNYHNLFGKIEYANELGGLKTDHTRIIAGSLHEANGGYIILQAKDILQSRLVWEGLKRALSTEELKIENVTGLSIISETLRPEPIPLDIKVIIIGDYLIYHLLYTYDEEFKKLFKIKADFDTEMDRNEENILKIGSFVAYQCKEEGLKPFHKSALGAVIDLSSRIAENKNKLTSSFNELVEILYESDAWATRNGREVITKEDVEMAILKKTNRNNSYEEKLLELIEEGTILIDTEGEKVGEINGLSIIDLGQYAFGRPNKITVNTYFGKDGIINIEKEADQSGNIHDKGVLILTGYLGEKYAKDTQLYLTASITFEQSYSGIDGDSASSTELYALLSSLAEVPINQAIAVTGSVNQKGVIQPIGGVNEKIEGFYKVCKLKGLKGNEGVIIPEKNIENLMLDKEVTTAVEEGKFNIYAVRTIDEGMEILTGLKAGSLKENGKYEEGSINSLVQKKLEYYSMLNKESEI